MVGWANSFKRSGTDCTTVQKHVAVAQFIPQCQHHPILKSTNGNSKQNHIQSGDDYDVWKFSPGQALVSSQSLPLRGWDPCN